VSIYIQLTVKQKIEVSMHTTLNKILKFKSRLARGDYEKLLSNLGKTKPDDEPVEILTILELVGVDCAMRCLHAVEGHEKEIRLFVIWCARQVQHLCFNKNSRNALDVAEDYANCLEAREKKDELDQAINNALYAIGPEKGSRTANSLAEEAAWSAARFSISDTVSAVRSAVFFESTRFRPGVFQAKLAETAINKLMEAQKKELVRICLQTN
jgi:hypothetical protein